jgi:ankyrin repeat protein
MKSAIIISFIVCFFVVLTVSAENPLEEAVRNGNLDALKLLLKDDRDLFYRNDYSDQSLLHMAIKLEAFGFFY